MWTPAERDENGRLLRAALQRQVKADARYHEYTATVQAGFDLAERNLPKADLDAYALEFVEPVLQQAEKEGKAKRTIQLLRQELLNPKARKERLAKRRGKYHAGKAAQPDARQQTPDSPEETERDREGTREKERLKKQKQRAAAADPLKERRKALVEFIKTATEKQLQALEGAMRSSH